MDKKILSVIPECFVETNMAEVFVKSSVNHQNGCCNVTRVMTTAPFLKNGFAVGLIDDDKRKSSYCKEFEVIASVTVSDKAGYSIMHHKDSSHYLVVTTPAMEMLMIECVKAAGKNMSDFGLPDKLDELTTQTKVNGSEKNTKFTNLFSSLSGIEGSPLFNLKVALNYMIDHPYSISPDNLLKILGL